MVKNEQNQTAVRYYQTIPHVIEVNSHEYAFSVARNVCLAWIHEVDLDKVLAITKQCCGGNKKQVYHLANEQDVRLWSGQSDR